MSTIDLNADLGETLGREVLTDDEALLQLVSSANLACGFHAGDPLTMARVCRAAGALGVRVGAHVCWFDRDGFGRRPRPVEPERLSAELTYQIGALAALAADAGVALAHVKAHGALYNLCFADEGAAQVVLAATRAVDAGLALLTPPDSALAHLAHRAGSPVIGEGFIDRAYRPDGSLVPRSEPGAVLGPEAAVDQAVHLATSGRYQSLCLHGDSPEAVAVAARVRAALGEAGVAVAAPR